MLVRLACEFWPRLRPHNPVVGLLVLILSTTSMQAQVCKIAWMDFKVSGTNWGKCGYLGCAPGSPPAVFLVESINLNCSYTNVDCPASPNPANYTTITYQETTTSTLDRTMSTPTSMCQLYTSPTATVTYSGSASYSDTVSGDSSDCSTTQNSSGVWSDGACETACSGDFAGVVSYMVQTVCTSNMTVLSTNGSFGSGAYGNYILSQTTTLSTFYSDNLLQADVQSRMPAYPSVWSGEPGSASWCFCDGNHYQATGSQMQYRVKVPNSTLNTTAKCHWQEVTASCPSGSIISITDKTCEIQGTGDPVNPAVSQTFTVPMPQSPSTITETPATIYDEIGTEIAGNGGPTTN